MMHKKRSAKQQLRWKKDLRYASREWANIIGVKPAGIRIQRMSKKWASCSTKGRISFNTELMNKSRRFQEYVIVHELLHLHVPNHGKLFKVLMNAYLPGWKKDCF
jgi:predicted metal-dependent hydrolase